MSITSTKTKGLKFHPLADIFPLMEVAEFGELVASIKANGLREPIVMFEDMILDGRNRYLASRAAGIEPTFASYHGDDPKGFVVDKNIHRRHLTAAQKRDLITKLLKADPEKSDREIGRMIKAGQEHRRKGPG
jgi:ParB-like chromosome segregation protein Spo0J